MVGKTTALAIYPNKMQVLHSALSRLCSAQHKVLIFCDDLFCLRWTSLIMASQIPDSLRRVHRLELVARTLGMSSLRRSSRHRTWAELGSPVIAL